VVAAREAVSMGAVRRTAVRDLLDAVEATAPARWARLAASAVRAAAARARRAAWAPVEARLGYWAVRCEFCDAGREVRGPTRADAEAVARRGGWSIAEDDMCPACASEQRRRWSAERAARAGRA
jgi:hypothetical protein